MDQPHWTRADTRRIHRMLLDHPDTVERLYPDTEQAARSRRERAAAREAIDRPESETRACRYPPPDYSGRRPGGPLATTRQPQRLPIAVP